MKIILLASFALISTVLSATANAASNVETRTYTLYKCTIPSQQRTMRFVAKETKNTQTREVLDTVYTLWIDGQEIVTTRFTQEDRINDKGQYIDYYEAKSPRAWVEANVEEGSAQVTYHTQEEPDPNNFIQRTFFDCNRDN